MGIARLIASSLLGCALMLLGTSSAWAVYPDKQIWWVVPFAPGGAGDIVSRLVASRLAENLKQPVLIDNRPGAGGVVGGEYVARSKPDGYTVMWDASSHAVHQATRKLRFSYETDFVAITQVVNMPLLLVVPADAPYRTVDELVEYARKNPQKASYASAGPALAAHLAMEMLKSMAKVEIVHVPYKGNTPAMTAVASGEVLAYFATTPTTLPWIRSGKIRALAVASPTRLSSLPDVPTFLEQGYAGFVASEWGGLFAPKGTPPEIVQLLNTEIRSILNTPEMKEQFSSKLGLEPVTSSPQEFSQMVRSEMLRWTPVVQRLNLKVD